MGPDWLAGDLSGFARTGGGTIISTFQDMRCSKPSCRSPSPGMVHVLILINSGRFDLASRHIWVGKQSTGRDMETVSIGVVIGLAYVIPRGETGNG